MDSDDFEDRLRALRPRLHRYCARMTGSAIHGEDVLQDALVKALQARSQGTDVDNLEGWLFRIAHNASLDFLRGKARSTVVPLTDDIEAGPIAGHWQHDFTLRRLKLTTGATTPMHSRSEQEVIFVQEGTLEFDWDGGKLIMGAGDTLTVPIGLMHAFRNPTSADVIAFVIRGAAAPAAPVFADNRVAAE